MAAAERWRERWPEIQKEVAGVPLRQAHSIVVQRAQGVLPFRVEGGSDA